MKNSYNIFVPVVAALPLAQALAAEDPAQDEHHIFDEIIVAATPLERTVEQLAQPTTVLTGEALVKKQATSIGETLANELAIRCRRRKRNGSSADIANFGKLGKSFHSNRYRISCFELAESG